MKILIAGEDMAPSLGAEIKRKADVLRKRTDRAAPSKISPEIGALALHKARSDAEYLGHYMRLLRYRDAYDTYDFNIPRRSGFLGAIMAGFKKIMWKLLRYQHDRIAFRQNLINGLFTNAIEFEMEERRRNDQEINLRLERIENLLREISAPEKK